MTDINLLPQKKILNESEKKTAKIFSTAILIVSFLVLLIWGSTLIIGKIAANNLLNEQKIKQELQETFDQQIEKSQKIYISHKKIAGIKIVLNSRQLQSKNLKAIEKLIPNGIKVNVITLDGQGQLSLSLAATNLTSFNNFITTVNSKDGSKIFKNLTISGLRMGKNGDFTFLLGGTINKNNINTNESD